MGLRPALALALALAPATSAHAFDPGRATLEGRCASHAKGKAKKKRSVEPRAKDDPPEAAASDDPPPRAPKSEPAKVDSARLKTADLLKRARQLYEGLEYDQVIPLARAVLERGDADVDKRLDAYLLEGSCLAIVGDPVEAEKPFRFLLRGRPDFDMSPDTPPKILAVFRKVQVEERAIVDQLRELERRRMIQELALTGEPPSEAKGGTPLEFNYHLRDPRGVVGEVRLNYRREAEPNYSALALTRDESGDWRGVLPREWTASANDYRLDYFLSTSDATGHELLSLGSGEGPLRVSVRAGEIEEAQPFVGSVWFWAMIAGAAVASGAAGYVIFRQATALPPSDLGEVPLR